MLSTKISDTVNKDANNNRQIIEKSTSSRRIQKCTLKLINATRGMRTIRYFFHNDAELILRTQGNVFVFGILLL